MSIDHAGVAACEVFVAGQLGVAAVLKVKAGGMSPFALRRLGVPAGFVRPLRWTIPCAELMVAVLVAWPACAVIGGLAAIGLLSVFTVTLAANIALGRRPECACFGPGMVRPISGRSILRNLSLMAAALFVVLSGPAAQSPAGQALVVALAVIAVQTRLLVTGSSNSTVDELAPPFELAGIDGGLTSLRSVLRYGDDVLLLFIDPDCEPCHRLLPSVAPWQDQFTVLVVSTGGTDVNRRLAEAAGVRGLLLQAGDEVSRAYGVAGTPSAVHVRGDGTLAGRPLTGADEITEHVRALLKTSPDGSASWAPGSLGIDRRSGETIHAAGPPGTRTVVISIAHPCPDCAPVLDALRSPAEDRIVFLTSRPLPVAPPSGTVAVDAGGQAARALGLPGAPAAVVLDDTGAPLAEPAVGSAAVLATLTGLTV